MKKCLKLLFLFALVSCTSNKQVFWCGDHECINKAEKEEYFKKNMIVEVRKKNNTSNAEVSKLNEMLQQATLKNEKNSKQKISKKLTWKQKRLKKKEEKRLAKKLLNQERKKIKDQKRLQKELLKEKKAINKKKKSDKVVKKKLLTKKIKKESSNFNDLFIKISEQSSKKSFPNINNTQ